MRNDLLFLLLFRNVPTVLKQETFLHTFDWILVLSFDSYFGDPIILVDFDGGLSPIL